ncbi:MAG: molybdenum cofactor guanylyltransferase [Tuberibacillus sp.]
MAQKVGVLLAGGQSRRFGDPKAFSLYKGKPMYEWAVDALSPIVEEMVVVSHPSLTDRFQKETSFTVLEDAEAFKGMGPLAGIYSAMQGIRASWYFIAPCDTPLIKEDVYRFMEEELHQKRWEGIIPTIAGRLQPLISIYSRKILPDIFDLLSDKKLKMSGLLEHAFIDTIELKEMFPENLFINVNTKSDLFNLEQVK